MDFQTHTDTGRGKVAQQPVSCRWGEKHPLVHNHRKGMKPSPTPKEDSGHKAHTAGSQVWIQGKSGHRVSKASSSHQQCTYQKVRITIRCAMYWQRCSFHTVITSMTWNKTVQFLADTQSEARGRQGNRPSPV